jgi:polysaccharide export outer membrane protein
MNGGFRYAVLVLAGLLLQQVLVVAAAQEEARVAMQSAGQAETTKPGTADGERSPELAGDRHPLYRLCRSDVVEVTFTFSPEFNQVVSVLPDGFIALKAAEQVYAAGRTLPELREAIRTAYAVTLHQPEVTVALKEFDRPHFFATGEVVRPGKYELRGATTVTEAVTIAGGFTGQAKHSQVVLFRRTSDDLVEARVLDVKEMLRSQNLAEDIHLKPGDLLYVPQNTISKVRQYLRPPNMGLYLNPGQF